MSHALHTLASYPELENSTADMGLQAKPIDLNKQVYGTTFGEQALATKRRLSSHLYFPLIDKVKHPAQYQAAQQRAERLHAIFHWGDNDKMERYILENAGKTDCRPGDSRYLSTCKFCATNAIPFKRSHDSRGKVDENHEVFPAGTHFYLDTMQLQITDVITKCKYLHIFVSYKTHFFVIVPVKSLNTACFLAAVEYLKRTMTIRFGISLRHIDTDCFSTFREQEQLTILKCLYGFSINVFPPNVKHWNRAEAGIKRLLAGARIRLMQLDGLIFQDGKALDALQCGVAALIHTAACNNVSPSSSIEAQLATLGSPLKYLSNVNGRAAHAPRIHPFGALCVYRKRTDPIIKLEPINGQAAYLCPAAYSSLLDLHSDQTRSHLLLDLASSQRCQIQRTVEFSVNINAYMKAMTNMYNRAPSSVSKSQLQEAFVPIHSDLLERGTPDQVHEVPDTQVRQTSASNMPDVDTAVKYLHLRELTDRAKDTAKSKRTPPVGTDEEPSEQVQGNSPTRNMDKDASSSSDSDSSEPQVTRHKRNDLQEVKCDLNKKRLLAAEQSPPDTPLHIGAKLFYKFGDSANPDWTSVILSRQNYKQRGGYALRHNPYDTGRAYRDKTVWLCKYESTPGTISTCPLSFAPELFSTFWHIHDPRSQHPVHTALYSCLPFASFNPGNKSLLAQRNRRINRIRAPPREFCQSKNSIFWSKSAALATATTTAEYRELGGSALDLATEMKSGSIALEDASFMSSNRLLDMLSWGDSAIFDSPDNPPELSADDIALLSMDADTPPTKGDGDHSPHSSHRFNMRSYTQDKIQKLAESGGCA